VPKREDEYWAAMKEPQGQGLCPRCGSSNISYNKEFQSWRCNKCEHSFPIPSYGPGGDFGKEARWFGKTTEEMKRKEFAEARAARRAESSGKVNNTNPTPSGKAWFGNEYYDTRSKKWKRPKGGSFPMKKAFLVLLVIACLAAVGWTGYLLLTDKTDPVSGVIILLVNIGVLFWNISVLRKYRVGAGTIISIFLVIVLLGATVGAFAGVEPFAEVKDKVVDFLGGSDIKARIVPESVNIDDRYCSLQVELIPSDSIKLDSIYSVQLISSEGYSFGRSLVYWTPDNLRTIKTATFTIPASDKVAAGIKNLNEEVSAKLFYGEDLVSVTYWYETNLNKILKVIITSNVELVTEANIKPEPLVPFANSYIVSAVLPPSPNIEAGKLYSVLLLWEVGGECRWASVSVEWKQIELDSKMTQVVSFGLVDKDICENYTFSIKVLPYSDMY